MGEKTILDLSFNERLGAFLVPFWVRNLFKKEIDTLGYAQMPYSFFAYMFYGSIFVNIAVTFTLLILVFPSVSSGAQVFLGLLLIILVEFALYILIYFFLKAYFLNLTYHRAKEIEKTLPDFLTELNLHIRSGVPLNRAIESSTNPEYGFLNKVIKDIIKNIRLGYSTKESFLKVAHRYRSSYFIEAAELIGKADEEGGNSIVLIDRLIENINTHHYMQEQIITNVAGYTFFITMMALIIAPALFASSYQVLVLIKTMINSIFMGGATSIGNFSLEITVDEGKYKIFSLFATLITAFCSAYLMSVIKEGNVKKAMKSVLIFVLLSFGSFLFFHWLLEIMFSSFFAF